MLFTLNGSGKMVPSTRTRSIGWAIPVFVLLAIVAAVAFLKFGVNGSRAGEITEIVLTTIVIITFTALIVGLRKPVPGQQARMSDATWPKVTIIASIAILLGITVLIVLLVGGKAFFG